MKQFLPLNCMKIINFKFDKFDLSVRDYSCQEFFENPAFRADGLKIYPTLVIRGTGKSQLFIISIFFFFLNRSISVLSYFCV